MIKRYTGVCVGGPKDGLYLEHPRDMREHFEVAEKVKGPDGRYTSVSFNKLGEYRFEDGRWKWHGLQ